MCNTRFPIGFFIFIDDGKGGAAGYVLHPHHLTQSMYKSSFAGTHFSMKCDRFAITQTGPGIHRAARSISFNAKFTTMMQRYFHK
jgi:hypothetical protein